MKKYSNVLLIFNQEQLRDATLTLAGLFGVWTVGMMVALWVVLRATPKKPEAEKPEAEAPEEAEVTLVVSPPAPPTVDSVGEGDRPAVVRGGTSSFQTPKASENLSEA